MSKLTATMSNADLKGEMATCNDDCFIGVGVEVKDGWVDKEVKKGKDDWMISRASVGRSWICKSRLGVGLRKKMVPEMKN